MLWRLCSPLGTSERTAEADDLFWAKRRFAPIPSGWFVVSDASYRIPCLKVDAPQVCSKCLRHPVPDGLAQCEGCRKTKRNAYRKTHGLDPLHPVREHRARRVPDSTPLPEPTGPVMRSTEVGRRLGIATKSVFSRMAKYGFTPVEGYVPPVKKGRPERQWSVEDVKVAQAKLNGERSCASSIARGIAYRRAKRELQLSLGV